MDEGNAEARQRVTAARDLLDYVLAGRLDLELAAPAVWEHLTRAGALQVAAP